MKFRENVNVELKEIKKEIDTEQNRAIINKTMKADNIKKTTNTSPGVGWLKGYVGKIDGDKNN